MSPTKIPLIIENGGYRVSKKNRYARPVYWDNLPSKLVRGYYFTSDTNPIEPKIVDGINRHLDRFFQKQHEKKGDGGKEKKLEVPERLKILNATIKFKSLVDFTIQRDSEKKVLSVTRYFKKARWTGLGDKIENLVFVVHGIWHDKKELSIVECMEKLNAGLLNGMDGENTGIQLIPIHWRTNIEDSEHVCISKCSEGSTPSRLLSIDEDLRLYNCNFYGRKIRQKVLSKIHEFYKTFLTHNPNFTGKISLFGHSLGSVICYDILTTMEADLEKIGFKKIEKFFAVGSPLWFYLDRRGSEALAQFKKTLETLKIINIYHSCDVVAGRLEPLLHWKYKNEKAILMQDGPEASVVHKVLAGAKKKAHRRVKKRRRSEEDLEQEDYVLKSQIDYKMKVENKLKDLQPHSKYWGDHGCARLLRRVLIGETLVYRRQAMYSKRKSTVETTIATTTLAVSNKAGQTDFRITESATTSTSITSTVQNNEIPIVDTSVLLEKLNFSTIIAVEPTANTNC